MSRLRRAALHAAVIVANAVVQAILVAVAPRQPLDLAAVALAIVSGLALLAASAALWAIALGRLPRRRLLIVISAGIAVALLAVAAPYLIPLAVAASCVVVAAGGFRAARGLARRHAWRVVALVVLTIAAVAAAFVLATLLGLLVTGAPAAAIEWLVVGTGAALIVEAWARLARPQP